MRSWRRVSVILFLLVLHSTIAFCEETIITTKPKHVYPVAKEDPQTVQGVFLTGTALVVISEKESWLQVKGRLGGNEQIGWITKDGIAEYSPPMNESNTPKDVPDKERMKKYAISQDHPVFLRDKPSNLGQILHTIPNGSLLIVAAIQDKWCKVAAISTKMVYLGWIEESDLRFDGTPEVMIRQAITEREAGLAEDGKERLRFASAELEEQNQRLNELEAQARRTPKADLKGKLALYKLLSELAPENEAYLGERKTVEEEKRKQEEEKRRQEALRVWLAKIDALPDSEAIKNLVRERKIALGMTAEAVLLSWGKPHDKNSSFGSWGKHEQWIYRIGHFKADYLYFENGILKSVQLEGR